MEAGLNRLDGPRWTAERRRFCAWASIAFELNSARRLESITPGFALEQCG